MNRSDAGKDTVRHHVSSGLLVPHVSNEIQIAQAQSWLPIFRHITDHMPAIQKELSQRGHIGQSLQRRVHVTRVTDILQAHQTSRFPGEILAFV